MEWLSAGANLLGGIAQIFTQGAQYKHEKSLNERSIQAQKDQAEYAYSKELEQWERSNAYNAPTQQMSRLREAGLNPAMIYGSQGAKTTAAQSPKYQSVKPEYNYSPPIDPTSVLRAYQDFRRNNAEVDLIKQNAKKARAEADNAEDYYWARARTGATKYWQTKKKYNWQNEMVEGRSNMFRKLDAELGKDTAQIDNLDSRTQLTDKQIEYYLFSTFGNMAIGATKALLSPMKYIKGIKGLKGVPKGVTVPKYNSPASWNRLPGSKFWD